MKDTFNSRNEKLKVAMQTYLLTIKEKQIDNDLYSNSLFLIHHLIKLVIEIKKIQHNFVDYGQFIFVKIGATVSITTSHFLFIKIPKHLLILIR